MSWQGQGHWQSWQGSVETALKGLGLELVDAERSAGGLLRVTIDHVPASAHPAAVDERSVTVDDCERATRQLQHVLEVEGVDYRRLEVSSPGLDRPLKRAADYERFSGQPVALTLKAAYQGRKHWQGRLEARDPPEQGGWRLVLPAEGSAAPQALDFTLDEVREARLVPVIDFKGRGRSAQAGATSPEAAQSASEPPARGARRRGKAAGDGGGDARADGRAEPASADAPVARTDGGRIR